MKKLFLSLVILCSLNAQAQFIDKDYTQAGLFVDPTFTDSGFQLGAIVTKIMRWGFASVETSTYLPDLNGTKYSDVVVTLGLNWNFNRNSDIRYYSGFRLGRNFRTVDSDTNGHNLVGGVIGVDVSLNQIFKLLHINLRLNGVYAGVRLWTDYREDQKDEFLGDSDAYERGIITNNPLLQENGAVLVLINW